MKEKISLQEQLKMELERYNSINQYSDTLLTEQAPPPAPIPNPDEELPDPNELTGGAEGGVPEDPTAAADPLGDAGADVGGEDPLDDGVADELPEPESDDTTEEIDVTDLYNMTKNIKQELENKQGGNDEVMQKMDGIFQMIGDLGNKLNSMDGVMQKIDQLGGKIEQMKPPTPQEKLEMRSLDSYPFNKKPNEFFNEKKPEMEKTRKNEYVLTKNDVQNYSKNDILKTFNPDVNDY